MKKRVAILGAGFIGQQHAEAIRRIPGAEVVALVDANEEVLISKAKELDIEHTYTDYKKMISDLNPDIVHNCTPNGMHYELNKHIIEKGIHVYCEKPLSIKVDEGEELIELANKHNVAAGVNFNYRNNAVVQDMKERIKNDTFGRIFHVSGQYYQDWMMLDTDYNWRLESDVGGASRTVADIGSHWFDTIQFILGKKIVAINAELLTVHPFRKKTTNVVRTFQTAGEGDFEKVPVSSEDAAFVMVRFEDGTFGNLNLSQVCGGHLNDLRVEVAGEKYSMEWQQQKPDTLILGSREQGQQIIHAAPNTLTGDAARYTTLPGGHPVGWSEALRNSIGEFYASVEEGSFGQGNQTYSTFKDGVQIMKLVEACMDSARSKSWVSVNE